MIGIFKIDIISISYTFGTKIANIILMSFSYFAVFFTSSWDSPSVKYEKYLKAKEITPLIRKLNAFTENLRKISKEMINKDYRKDHHLDTKFCKL